MLVAGLQDWEEEEGGACSEGDVVLTLTRMLR
jgi:hypothetical protein